MKKLFTSGIMSNKRKLYLASLSVLVLLCVALNTSFSAFTESTNRKAVNIKVGNLTYHTVVNNNETFILKGDANGTSRYNVLLVNDNSLNTKYELTYDVCTNSNCSATTDKPEGFDVKYSSLTVDDVTGVINTSGSKSIRLIITNTTNSDIYIKLGVNAGFSYNTLRLVEDITEEYIEDDLYVKAYKDGEEITTFPNSSNYTGVVSCNNSASGIVRWDGSAWKLNIISDISAGETICNVNFTTGATTLRNAITASNTANGIASTPATTPGQQISTSDEKVFATTTDDYGTSYYYRGNIPNNYLIFANKCWRIVRITGNGSGTGSNAIKLFYWGNVTDNNTCNNNSNYTTSPFNNAKWDGLTNGSTADALSRTDVYTSNRPAGVGFMYGEVMGTTYNSVHSNNTDSTILQVLKGFYNEYIIANHLEDYLEDVIWCNDKSLASNSTSTTGADFDKYTFFKARERIYASNVQNNMNPSLVCPNAGSDNKLSKFTASDTTKGNGKLKSGNTEYKIGLLTVDEAAFAGGRWLASDGSANNTTFYLYTGGHHWLLSPVAFYTDIRMSSVWYVGDSGYLDTWRVVVTLGVRPSVSLKSTVTILGGNGLASNPYIIN